MKTILLLALIFFQGCTIVPVFAGSGTISQVTENRVRRKHTNDIRSALYQDLVPRNSSGVATDSAGSLGTTAFKWLKLRISSGYWDIGDIKYHHDFSGVTPIGQGWYPCDGTTINETNYNAIHGAGSWAIFVVSSALDGTASPNLDGIYLIGENTTAQHGNVEGNVSHQINLEHSHTSAHTHSLSSHTHTGPSHNHQWHNFIANSSTSQGYDTGGGALNMTQATATAGIHLQTTSLSSALNNDLYTSNAGTGATAGPSNNTSGAASAGIGNSLSTTQSIQPRSMKMGAYVRVID